MIGFLREPLVVLREPLVDKRQDFCADDTLYLQLAFGEVELSVLLGCEFPPSCLVALV
jgi:hypothetical protein